MKAWMPNISLSLASILLTGIACHDLRYVPSDGGIDGGQSCQDCDMADANLACIAAKGLTGKPLVCLDFDSKTDLNGLKSDGWKFDKFQTSCPTNNVWGIQNGALQVQDFSNFGRSGAGSCGFSTPLIPSNQLGEYRRVTLSVQHTLDLNDPKQTAQIFYNDNMPAERVLWQGTGNHTVSRQQTAITLNISDLPMADKQTDFVWIFTLTSTAASMTAKGWQIESIAVVGQK